MLKLSGACLVISSLALGSAAFAAGDAAKGEKVFRKCAACHSIEEGAKSKTGPNLHGIVGRVTGTLEGFKYSPAMLKAGEEGHIWTLEELDLFLTNPKSMIQGHKMSFAGLKKDDERADVIAYLLANSPNAEAPAAATEAAPAP